MPAMTQKMTPLELYEKMQKEVIPCNICGSENHAQVFDRYSYQMGIDSVLCRHCGFLFTNPRPTMQEIEEFYRNVYRGKADSNKPVKEYNKDSSPYRRAQWLYSLVEPELGKRGDAPAVLDVGCGTGVVLHLFRLNSPKSRLFGVEPSPPVAVHAGRRNQADVTVGDLNLFVNTRGDLAGTLDVIILNHVLEHLYHPVEDLARLRRFLKPDGLILVQVPNPFSTECPGLLRMFHMAHVNQFSPRTLRCAFERAGYRNITEHPGNPRAMTFLCRNGGPGLSQKEVPPLAEREFDSLLNLIRDKAHNESLTKIQMQKPIGEKIARFFRRRFHHAKNDPILRNLLEGEKVLIIGPGISSMELDRIPEGVKILTANTAAKILIDRFPEKTIDLFIGVQSMANRKKLRNLLPKLAQAKVGLFLFDDRHYLKKKIGLNGIYSRPLYDDGLDAHYLKKLIRPKRPSDLKTESGISWTSAEIRLLQMALYFGAREIYLIGVDFTVGKAFWKTNNRRHQYAGIDEHFIDIIRQKYRHVYSLSKQSPIAQYLPYRGFLEQHARHPDPAPLSGAAGAR